MVDAADAKAWARETVKGQWGSPPVPFTVDGDLDKAGIRTNVDYIVGSMADGVGFGFTEPWFMTIAEQVEAFETFAGAVNKRIPFYFHAMDYRVPETIGLINNAKRIGASAVMLWTPMEFAKSDDMAVEWFEYICSNVDIAVFAYNTYHSNINLSPEALERIAAIPNVCAIKDAVNDFAHTVEIERRVGTQVVVSNPLEEYLAAATIYTPQQVLLGATSVFLMQSPKLQPIRDYWLNARAGKGEETWEQYYALKPLRDLWTDSYKELWNKKAALHPLPTIKYWMDLIGMVGGNSRLPMKALPQADRETFRERLESTGWVSKLWGELAA